jgi:hypothetical protein
MLHGPGGAFFKGGRRTQPIHGQPDAVLSGAPFHHSNCGAKRSNFPSLEAAAPENTNKVIKGNNLFKVILV